MEEWIARGSERIARVVLVLVARHGVCSPLLFFFVDSPVPRLFAQGRWGGRVGRVAEEAEAVQRRRVSGIPILREEVESVQVCTKRFSPALAPTEGPPCANRANAHKHRDAWREPVPGPAGPRSVGTVQPASFPRYAPAAGWLCTACRVHSCVSPFPFRLSLAPQPLLAEDSSRSRGGGTEMGLSGGETVEGISSWLVPTRLRTVASTLGTPRTQRDLIC